MITLSYDRAPDKTGLFISGWKEREHDGVTQRTNVKHRVDGRLTFLWPEQVDGVWLPAWAEVVE